MYNSSKATYPKHNIDPKHKDSAWRLQYIKAFWGQYANRSGKMFYNNRGQYARNLKYLLGQQDTTPIKESIGVDPNDTTYVNTSWDVVPILPKFIEIVVGKMATKQWSVDCVPVDPVSLDAEKKIKSRIEAQVFLKKTLERVRSSFGVQGLQELENIPDALEEVPLYMDMHHKPRLSISMEKGLDLMFHHNKWEQLVSQLDRDFLVYGAYVCKDYVDTNGMPSVRRVDPRKFLTSFTSSETFDDCEAFAEVRTMSVAELERKIGKDISSEDKQKIVEMAQHSGNKQGYVSDATHNLNDLAYDYRFGSAYDDQVVSVLDIEFQTTNTDYYERKTNRHGNHDTYRKDFGYKAPKKSKYKREVKKDAYSVWHKATWVIGTDLLFDDGLVRNQKVSKSSFEKALPSYHVVAPGMIDLNVTSFIEKMIPMADDIQLNVQKLRIAVAKARQKGLLIEIGGLENIPKGKGGETFDPLELISIYDQTGNMLYRRLDDMGNPMGPPMQELENGMARDVITHINIINFYLGMLRDATGINEVADASTPHPDMLKGVAEMVMQSTNNALHSVYNGRKWLFLALANSLTLRTQEGVKTKTLKGYAQALGSADYYFIEVDADVSLAEYGIKLVDVPDDQERMNFEARLAAAVEQRSKNGRGGITIADYYKLKDIPNLKQAQRYLQHTLAKLERQDEQRALRDVEANSRQQQESAMVAAQAKQEELVLETDEKIRFEQAKADIENKLKEEEHQRKMEELRLKAELDEKHTNLKDSNKAVVANLSTQSQ